MIEFFEDQTKNSMEIMESDEKRLTYEYTDFDELEEVVQREDMMKRQIDTLELVDDNFFACISKEIFGTESNVSFVREHICKEMADNPKLYKSLMMDRFKTDNIFVETHDRNLKNTFSIDDIYILASATFFQTPIYVLEIETDGSSRWKDYTQIRKKPRPLKKITLVSKCRKLEQHDKYYVTLLRIPTGQYHRIVPKQDDCNCFLAPPDVPSRTQGILSDLVINGIYQLRTIITF